MFRIGNVQLASNLLLAPIARYCDLAFRLVVRPLGGLGLAYTELVNPRGLLEQTPQSMRLISTEPADQPLAVQLYGCRADELTEAARWCEAHGFAVIDLNMGCPVKKVWQRGGGAAMLRDPETAVRVAEAVGKAVRIPVTVKMRLGWDDSTIVAPELATALEAVGIAAITVHGRTAAQRFSGPVRLDEIARVVRGVRHIPVIGNGDVRSPADARAMLERTGCAGVMIGRYALREPWVFRDTYALLTNGTVPPPPSVDERIALMNRQFEHLLRLHGERRAMLAFRQRVTWYASKLGIRRTACEPLRHALHADEYWRWIATVPGMTGTTNSDL